ncbi:MAR-binding filament-like protein 1 [Phalaenopsis equestris]|uniref:MAR-binding filament-like protein 1 n=1 Tax=Phalaenopsis equestris TaxID=78828 RepID=UPI0009E59E50|nr:MAR-binding filament-like protein 1 [Phalaenopsis equestris]
MSAIGGSIFLQSALCQSSPSSRYCSPLMYPSHRKVARKRRASVISYFWNGGRSFDERYSVRRRVVLLVGISVFPLLQFREVAAEEPVEAIDAVSNVGGFANIFLSQRNRSKVVKPLRTNILDKSAFKGTKLRESNIDTSDSRATAIESQVPRAAENDVGVQFPTIKKQEFPSQQHKQAKGDAKENSGGSSFVSFINGIGIIGSGVLGALFSASQREKKALESTIDSMTAQANDQEIAAALMKKSFETKLLNEQEDYQRQLRKLKDDEASLLSQLTSAKDAAAALGRELNDEKKFVEELISQRGQLEHSLTLAREDKKLLEDEIHKKVGRITSLQDELSHLSLENNEKMSNIQNLKSLLAKTESECKNMSSALEQARFNLATANSRIEQLKEDINMVRTDSNSKDSIIDDLHEKIKSLTEEKNDSNIKFYDLMKEYNALVSYSERTTVLNSELLSRKDEQLQQLDENLKIALNEASSKHAIISELTIERDNAIMLLEKEKNNIYKLTNELQSAQEMLDASEAKVSHTSKELTETRTAYEEVMSTISKMQNEYDQTRQLMNYNLEEAKATSMILSDKLESAKVVLKHTEEELVSASNELRAAIEERESLKMELVDNYQKIQTTSNQLQEERKTVTNLNKELEALQKQILKDSEARRSLEADLDEATRSLDEMNKSALLLSKELENTNSRSASLETEKEILYMSLIEQKNIAKDSLENMQDAEHLISRLGSEREKLEKRSKRLEEELAAAKGEILRLRRKVSVGQGSINEHHSKSNEVPAGAPFSVKRNVGRRKKQSLGSDDS